MKEYNLSSNQKFMLTLATIFILGPFLLIISLIVVMLITWNMGSSLLSQIIWYLGFIAPFILAAFFIRSIYHKKPSNSKKSLTQ